MSRGARVFGSLLLLVGMLVSLVYYHSDETPTSDGASLWRRGVDLGIKDTTSGSMKTGLNRYLVSSP